MSNTADLKEPEGGEEQDADKQGDVEGEAQTEPETPAE